MLQFKLNKKRTSTDVELLLTTKLWRKQMNERAERINGWAAMIGVIAAIGAYATTGQIIPGIF
jgi:hypothetical protein